MSLTNGYLQAPSSVYFTGGSFTVMLWIYPRSFNSFSRIIDFGNGANSDSVVWCFSWDTTGQLNSYLTQNPTNVFNFSSSQAIQLNQWQHLSFVFTVLSPSNIINIYVNGILFATTNWTGQLNNVIRTSNYIGKDNWNASTTANAIFDELKIFSAALTQSEIRFEMNNNWFADSSSLVTTSSMYLAILF